MQNNRGGVRKQLSSNFSWQPLLVCSATRSDYGSHLLNNAKDKSPNGVGSSQIGQAFEV